MNAKQGRSQMCKINLAEIEPDGYSLSRNHFTHVRSISLATQNLTNLSTPRLSTNESCTAYLRNKGLSFTKKITTPYCKMCGVVCCVANHTSVKVNVEIHNDP